MQEKTGISLIVLVITIIVMIILAGAIVLTLNNSGIIDRAEEAVDKTDEAQVKQIAQLAWAEAYTASYEKGETITKENLEEVVLKKLEDEKIDTSKYAVEVTTKGVNVVLKGPWIQTGETVTNGKITIKVGDKTNYTATGTSYTGDWRVLGASKYGELLIMSDSDVVSNYNLINDEKKGLRAYQEAWLNGAKELDKICEPYGKGEGATGARSVTLEDVDRATEFDKTTYWNNASNLTGYGTEVTYKYDGTTKPIYTTTKYPEGEKVWLEYTDGFHYYDGADFVKADLSKTTGIITTLKMDHCNYGVWDNWKAYTGVTELLFGIGSEEDVIGNDYWLATSWTFADVTDIRFGIHCINELTVSGFTLWDAKGSVSEPGKHGVRAVVSLDIGANISENTAGGWNINK